MLSEVIRQMELSHIPIKNQDLDKMVKLGRKRENMQLNYKIDAKYYLE